MLPGAELPRRISIHALREEGDRWLYRMFHRYLISIHALREEGDFKGRVSAPRDFLFLSTPSARRATCSTGGRNTPSKHFYPRPPRGGRQFYDEEECLEHEFLSTPSARRATRSLALAFRSPRNFYPRPPRGGRPG